MVCFQSREWHFKAIPVKGAGQVGMEEEEEEEEEEGKILGVSSHRKLLVGGEMKRKT